MRALARLMYQARRTYGGGSFAAQPFYSLANLVAARNYEPVSIEELHGQRHLNTVRLVSISPALSNVTQCV